MPLDPQAQKVMDQIAALGLPPNHTVSPEEARANMLARPRAAGPEVAKVANQTIPNGDYQVPVRIYTPAGSGPFPILCWFHGGGWVIGNLETADATARHLAVKSECVVVSVDYRLAPESKFPVPFDDCYAATEWAAHNAAAINGDPRPHCRGRRQRRRQPGGRGCTCGPGPQRAKLELPVAGLPCNRPGLPDRLLPKERRRIHADQGCHAVVLGPLPCQRRRCVEPLRRSHWRRQTLAAYPRPW